MDTPEQASPRVHLTDLAADVAGGSVWGSPSAEDNRAYWVDVTSPFGETVTFDTTWGDLPGAHGW